MKRAIYVPDYPTRPNVPAAAARPLAEPTASRPWAMWGVLLASVMLVAAVTAVTQMPADVAAETATQLWLGQ